MSNYNYYFTITHSDEIPKIVLSLFGKRKVLTTKKVNKRIYTFYVDEFNNRIDYSLGDRSNIKEYCKISDLDNPTLTPLMNKVRVKVNSISYNKVQNRDETINKILEE